MNVRVEMACCIGVHKSFLVATILTCTGAKETKEFNTGLEDSINLRDWIMERLAEIMVINRNCDPCSRRKLPSWFETTVLPILLNIKPSEVNDKLFLRTFPYLQEETTIPIKKEIYDIIIQVYGIKTEKIYYDITSSYFEGKSYPLSKQGNDL